MLWHSCAIARQGVLKPQPTLSIASDLHTYALRASLCFRARGLCPASSCVMSLIDATCTHHEAG